MSLPRLLASTGPAIIVASVVIGPGSIVTSSSAGWRHGYDFVWVIVGSCVLLVGMTSLAARLGVGLDGTPCEELARRAGRPFAVLAGLSLFLVASGFQFGNNLGVLYAIEPLLGSSAGGVLSTVVLIALNVAVTIALFGFRKLYRPVETTMKILVGVMILAFAVNLVFAWPSITGLLRGLVPRAIGSENFLEIAALTATTFSVGGAFYNAYLVRQKGWTRADVGRGLLDSIVGISTLCLVSLMIMATAAAVLHDNPNVESLRTVADVARQLRPLFGDFATVLFCTGILAGALSSFLVNAMIGGTVFSDGVGAGGSMDARWPKIFTTLALATGMGVAIAVRSAGIGVRELIIFAQAITVLGNPLLAGSLVFLALQRDVRARRVVPPWILALAVTGFAVVTLLSVRTVIVISQKLSEGT